MPRRYLCLSVDGGNEVSDSICGVVDIGNRKLHLPGQRTVGLSPGVRHAQLRRPTVFSTGLEGHEAGIVQARQVLDDLTQEE